MNAPPTVSTSIPFIYFAFGSSWLGTFLVAQSDNGICAILLGDDLDAMQQDLQQRFPDARLTLADNRFSHTVAQIADFINMPSRGLSFPLDIRGTPFQQKVWQALLEIPAGKTSSYTDIASRMGAPKSVRAVAGACAANALAVAIPCHRVVRSDGALSGYRWGVERKRALLERERTGSTFVNLENA